MHNDCPLCVRLPALRSGADPDSIAELDHSVVMLGDSFAWPGWCVLVLKEHVEHMDLLEPARRAGLFGEAALVGAALRGAGLASRVNYECLGNVVNHIHWHVIPRRADEPEARATVWTRPASERDRGGSAAQRGEAVRRIRAELDRQRS